MTRSALSNQIANRNFLAPVGFKFTLSKFPKVSFFSNTARIPDITLGTAIQMHWDCVGNVLGTHLQYILNTLEYIGNGLGMESKSLGNTLP